MKIFVSLIGAMIGSGLASIIPISGGLGAALKGIGAAIGFSVVMLLYGLSEERAELERIRLELDKDRPKNEQESKEHDDFMSNYY